MPSSVSQSEVAAHTTYQQMKRTLAKRKNINTPNIQSTLEETQVAVNSLPADIKYAKYYIGSVAAGQELAVGLGFNDVVGAFEGMSPIHIQIDATFSIFPNQLFQLMSIYGIVKDRGVGVPIVHILMDSKSEILYDASLEYARNRFFANIEVEKVTTDFESALQNSVSNVFGCRVQGCTFHHSQAIIRKIKSLDMYQE